MPAVTSGPARARDLKRREDLRKLANALELYHLDHGRYLIEGAGHEGTGDGWVIYDGPRYPQSIVRALREGGYLDALDIGDPAIPNPAPLGLSDYGYLLYICRAVGGGEFYSLSATLENPTDEEMVNARCVCATAIIARHGKNYAVGQRTPRCDSGFILDE